jgi:cytochrome c-type biogenesis protein CcmH/NrfG
MAQRYADTETADRARARLAAPEVPSDEALMRHGLDALYTQHDPAAAAAEFRQVLARNPTHYGATFQLAAALDAAGKRAEARPLWKKMLDMSVAVNDTETANAARARLASKP